MILIFLAILIVAKTLINLSLYEQVFKESWLVEIIVNAFEETVLKLFGWFCTRVIHIHSFDWIFLLTRSKVDNNFLFDAITRKCMTNFFNFCLQKNLKQDYPACFNYFIIEKIKTKYNFFKRLKPPGCIFIFYTFRISDEKLSQTLIKNNVYTLEVQQ